MTCKYTRQNQLTVSVLICLESEKCYHFLYNPTLTLTILHCNCLFACSLIVILLFYGPWTARYTLPALCTFVVAWFIARYCDGNVLFYPLDTITVHLLVWQCVGLMCSWQMHELLWFSLRLHQGFSCVLLAFIAYYLYELFLRYLSVRCQLGVIWFLTIYDM